MKIIILLLTLIALSYSVDVTQERFVCYAPVNEDYGGDCEALFNITGSAGDKLTYNVTVSVPDGQTVWCEGRSYKETNKPKWSWYLLGSGDTSFSYDVPWETDDTPTIRCKSLGTVAHLVHWMAALAS